MEPMNRWGYLRADVIGQTELVPTPFGERPLLYADYTASGRSLSSIESYIADKVLPVYGNTHSYSTHTSRQTTHFREEARQIAKQFYNATHEDALIFCGTGVTGAVKKWLEIMDRALWSIDSSRARRALGEHGERPASEGRYFIPDRWGSGVCCICDVRLENEHKYRAHEHTDGHRERVLINTHIGRLDAEASEEHNCPNARVQEEEHAQENLQEDAQRSRNKILQLSSDSITAEKQRKTHLDPPKDATHAFELSNKLQKFENDLISSERIAHRLNIFLLDPSLHHSSLLPFREMAKQCEAKLSELKVDVLLKNLMGVPVSSKKSAKAERGERLISMASEDLKEIHERKPSSNAPHIVNAPAVLPCQEQGVENCDSSLLFVPDELDSLSDVGKLQAGQIRTKSAKLIQQVVVKENEGRQDTPSASKSKKRNKKKIAILKAQLEKKKPIKTKNLPKFASTIFDLDLDAECGTLSISHLEGALKRIRSETRKLKQFFPSGVNIILIAAGVSNITGTSLVSSPMGKNRSDADIQGGGIEARDCEEHVFASSKGEQFVGGKEASCCAAMDEKMDCSNFGENTGCEEERQRISEGLQLSGRLTYDKDADNVKKNRSTMKFEYINAMVHYYEGIVCYDLAALHAKIDLNSPPFHLAHNSLANPSHRQDESNEEPVPNRAGSQKELELFQPEYMTSSPHIDVAFVSPHKFIGGPSTPGLLICKKKLMTNSIPSTPGGGVVFFVSQGGHSYMHNAEAREEAGTPDIIGCIRVGLTFRLHTLLNHGQVQMWETHLTRILMNNLSCDKRIKILGPLEVLRAPIVAFNILYSKGAMCPFKALSKGLARKIRTSKYLHHNFVVALLNDIFGIQTRGGCSCAGPYLQALLSISAKSANRFEKCISATGKEVVRPGAVRVSLSFLMSEEEVKFLSDAILWVCAHGWIFLPYYSVEQSSGTWRWQGHKEFRNRAWLSSAFSSLLFSETDFPLSPLERSVPFSTPQTISTAVKELESSSVKQPAISEEDNETHAAENKFASFKLDPPISESLNNLSNFLSSIPKRNTQIAHQAEVHNELLNDWRELLWFPWHGVNCTISVHLDTYLSHIQSGRIGFCTMSKNELSNAGSAPQAAESKLPSPQPNTESASVRAGVEHGQRTDTRGEFPDATVAGIAATTSDLSKKPTVQNSDSDEEPTQFVAGEVPNTLGNCEEQNATYPSEDSIAIPNFTLESCNCEDKEDTLPEDWPTTDAKDGMGLGGITDETGVDEKGCNISNGIKVKTKKQEVPKTLRRAVGNAIRDFAMIENGDKVLIGLSGGKDSLTLLHILIHLQKVAPVKFQIAAATVNPITPEYNPKPLIAYLHSLGVPYHMLEFPIIELAKEKLQNESLCSFCSRMKRGILYTCMEQNGYTALALGQHLDDICESFLMSLLHNGSLNTMKAHYVARRGLRVIRPLCYARESEMELFARLNRLPIIPDNCPACFAAPEQRHHMKILLSSESYRFPHVHQSMLKALKPLISITEAQDKVEKTETLDHCFDDKMDLVAQDLLGPCAGSVCPRL